MFVLMSLILVCLQRLFFALFPGIGRPTTPYPRASRAALQAAHPQLHPLAPIHAPTPRLII